MSHGNMDNDLIDQETCGLLVQLVRQKFGTKVEIVGMKLANRRTDYAVFLATLRFPSLEVVVKLAGPRAPYPYPFDRTAMFHHLYVYTEAAYLSTLLVPGVCKAYARALADTQQVCKQLGIPPLVDFDEYFQLRVKW